MHFTDPTGNFPCDHALVLMGIDPDAMCVALSHGSVTPDIAWQILEATPAPRVNRNLRGAAQLVPDDGHMSHHPHLYTALKDMGCDVGRLWTELVAGKVTVDDMLNAAANQSPEVLKGAMEQLLSGHTTTVASFLDGSGTKDSRPQCSRQGPPPADCADPALHAIGE